jgi:ribosomal protein S18 acetylase RimI-like enzyme
MRLEAVKSPESDAFRALWAIYESSFPPDERRDLASQAALFKDKRYSLTAAFEGGSLVGFISSWELGGFSFIEHFAVREGLRGHGTGTGMLKAFMAGRGRIVLEVEPPSDGLKKRRISFYERLGFRLDPRPYTQPPYGEGKKPVVLRLMAFPAALSGEEFGLVRSGLHTRVYKLAEPLL